MLFIFFLIVQSVSCEPLFGGNSVSKAELSNFDQMASVFVTQRHRCGGTLINKQWVLTASHCFLKMEDNIGDVSVVLGADNVKYYIEKDHIPSDIVIIHKNFNKRFNRDDVALIHLKRSAEVLSFRYHIPEIFDILPNLECEIAGYGSKHTLRTNSLILYSGKTRLISNDECASSMSVLLARDTICTKNRGTAPCGGDSGGPLFCGGYLVGVVSHGPVCHMIEMPSVYAFTPRYKKWIGRATTSYKGL